MHACSESPDCKLQDAPMNSAIGARGKSIYSTQSRLRAKSPCLRTPGYTRILAGNWYVNPHMFGKPRLRVARCANNQRHQSMWGEYMPDSVMFEGQNAVFLLPTSHTGFLAEIEPVDPHVLGKPGLRTARCTNDQRHRSTWGESMLDPVTVEDQNAVFRLPTSHTGFWRELNLRDPLCSESPGTRAARCTNDQLHRSMWGAYMPDSVLFEGQNASF